MHIRRHNLQIYIQGIKVLMNKKEIKHYNILTYFNNKYKIKMQKIFL